MREEKFFQQLHSVDDGPILLIANEEKDVQMICEKCRQVFIFSGFPFQIKVGNDFKSYIPEKVKP